MPCRSSGLSLLPSGSRFLPPRTGRVPAPPVPALRTALKAAVLRYGRLSFSDSSAPPHRIPSAPGRSVLLTLRRGVLVRPAAVPCPPRKAGPRKRYASSGHSALPPAHRLPAHRYARPRSGTPCGSVPSPAVSPFSASPALPRSLRTALCGRVCGR